MTWLWASGVFCVGLIIGAALAGRKTELYANALRRVITLTEPARLEARNKSAHVDESSWIQIRAVACEVLREGL